MWKRCSKVSLEPSLLQAKQPQLSQSIFVEELFQPSDHLYSPPLGLLSRSVSFLSWGTQSHMQHYRWSLMRAEWKGRITFLNLLATVLWMQPMIWWAASAHCQLVICWYHVLLHRADPNPFISQPVLLLGVAQMQVQDLTLRFRDMFSLPSTCFFRMFVLNLLAAQGEELIEIPWCAIESLWLF